MKIYKRQEFMALPAGVIFSKGEPWCWGNLTVKGDTIIHEGKAIDFFEMDLATVEANDTGEWVERQEAMLETGCSFPLDECYGRDGCFDDDALFLIYETDDLLKLRSIIESAMSVSNDGSSDE